MFEKFIEKRYQLLSTKYDEEIRDLCEHHRLDVVDCLKRLHKEQECKYVIDVFNKCIYQFDKNFKSQYRIK